MSRIKLLAMALLISCSQAVDAGGEPGSDVGTSLPPRVRGLLIQEMQAILGATKAILDALVRGEDVIVADNARAIHDSFIMKQEMTEADREALIDTVPPGFLERDRQFHELSARLAGAARRGDKPQQAALFADMLDACTGCHARFARGRFPGFDMID